MNRNVFIKIFSAVLTLCMMLDCAAFADSFKAEVYSSAMTVYESASTESAVLGTLYDGTQITVTAVSGDWAKIKYNGKTGYCAVSDLISLSHNKLMYTTKAVTVYATASSKGKKLDKLTADYPLYVVGASGDYYLVDDSEGNFTGYVLKSALSNARADIYAVPAEYKLTYSSGNSTTSCPKKVRSNQSYYAQGMGTQALREYLCYIAECRLGCMYEIPGTDNQYTFNNSGLVRSCFECVGYTLHGNQADIARVSESQRISRGELIVGDIVCFRCDSDSVNHLGIYVGSGCFVHSSPTAECTVISDIDSNYWSTAFAWGVRVIK